MTFKERQSRDRGIIENNRLMELHLYPGNRCNRDCDFCTVFGTPKGEYSEYISEHLDAALKTVMLHAQGAIKFYGGEPTLNHQNVIWAIAYLRDHSFTGAIVIYSNGIRAAQLLEILESDRLNKTTASLNYSIATGDGAPQMPLKSLQQLEAYEQAHAGAIAIGHPDIVDSGRGVDPFTGEETRPKVNSQCPHCYPVLKTDGQFHACPFAIENDAPHFHLGDLQSSPAEISSSFKAFFKWLDTVHQPYAEAHNLPACTVCWNHLDKLPTPGATLGVSAVS
ncbi:MAG: radical SAM protein [Phormidesmis sp.]